MLGIKHAKYKNSTEQFVVWVFGWAHMAQSAVLIASFGTRTCDWYGNVVMSPRWDRAMGIADDPRLRGVVRAVPNTKIRRFEFRRLDAYFANWLLGFVHLATGIVLVTSCASLAADWYERFRFSDFYNRHTENSYVD